MTYKVLNPTSEIDPAELLAAARLTTLQGKTVGIISNGKEGTRGFFAHLERLLHEQCQVGQVVFRQKSNYSAPAEASIIQEVSAWDLAVTGIGD